MSFAQDAGYLPLSVAELMSVVRDNVNTQFGTTYTEESFTGTNFYKFFYALIQRLQASEVKTAEIFAKLQEYFNVTNESLSRTNTTAPGIFDFLLENGYFISTKPPLDADAGKAFICVDVDSGAPGYAATKIAICNLIKNSIVAGVVTQGTESVAVTLSNGQSFDFKYNLPTKIATKLRLTLTLSENNEFTILSPQTIKDKLVANIAAKYRLGKNFEPQRYFSVIDAPWASVVLLEYSIDNGANYLTAVYNSDYDKVLTISPSDISLVEN